MDDTKATVTLKAEKWRGKRRPVIHILMADGRVTEFKHRGIAIAEVSDHAADDRIYALLINGDGDAFETPEGEMALVAVPMVGLDLIPNPERPVTFKEVAKQLGLSLPTVKRMVGDGRLPTPTKVGKRATRFRQGDIDAIRDSLKPRGKR